MAFRPPEYQAQFYISAEGISREVITTDICRYLGTNARIIRPNMDTNGRIIGYWYLAYRTFTDEMVRSLQEDSARWRRENDRNRTLGVAATTYGHPPPPEGPMMAPPAPPPAPPPMAPPPLPGQGRPDHDRFVYDGQGNPVFDLREGVYLNQPPPVMTAPQGPVEDTSRASQNAPPPVPVPVPAPVAAPYYAVDPVTGRACYVDSTGRMIPWAT